MLAQPLEISAFLLRAPPLEMCREQRESFQDEAGKKTLISSSLWGNEAPPEVCWNPSCSSRVGTGMSGNFLNSSKSGKDGCEVEMERRGFPCDATAEKSLILPAGEPPGFSRVAAGLSGVTMGTSGTRWHRFRKHQSPYELRWAPRDSCPVSVGS